MFIYEPIFQPLSFYHIEFVGKKKIMRHLCLCLLIVYLYVVLSFYLKKGFDCI